MPDSLWPHRLQPTRLLCPWDFPGKDTGVGCRFLLQGIFPAQGLNPGLLHCRQILYWLSCRGSHHNDYVRDILLSTSPSWPHWALICEVHYPSIPLHRQEDWGSESSTNLPKDTQLGSGGAGIWNCKRTFCSDGHLLPVLFHMVGIRHMWVFPGGSEGKEPTYLCRRHPLDPWIGKIPWRKAWQPTPVSLPGEFHWQRSLEGYSLGGCKKNWAQLSTYMCAHARVHMHTHTHRGICDFWTAEMLLVQLSNWVLILIHCI